MNFKEFLNETFNKKYPRTFHLPWSPGASSDDKILSSIEHLLNKKLTITEKMDGSNVGLSFHTASSRSGSMPTHISFDMLKQKHSTVKNNIPENMIFYGEWLYALHSISYENLDDYLMIFAILEDNKKWLSWKEVEEYTKMLDCITVPVLEDGIIFKTEKDLKEFTEILAQKTIKNGGEGIVLRLSDHFTDFSKSTAKYVRKNHVQTDQHWMHKEIEINKLKK